MLGVSPATRIFVALNPIDMRAGFNTLYSYLQAVNYFINEYEALRGCLHDGRHEIDQNLIENSIRLTQVGRKQWLFIGHPDAGWRSAVIYSILVSLRRRGINPLECLTDVMARLPAAKTSDIPSLLPANWKPPPTNAS